MAEAQSRAHREEVLQWDALEHEHREKSSDWYWALGIIAIAGALTAVILGNVLFALVVLLAAFVVALHASKAPEVVSFEINRRGVIAGNKFYPYRDLESFDVIDTESGETKLLLMSKKVLAPHIIIPLQDINTGDVEEYLEQYLPQEEHGEPLSEKIADLLGF